MPQRRNISVGGAKAEFIQQIRNMEWEKISEKNWKISGKKKGNDDVAVTGMMVPYWVRNYVLTPGRFASLG